MTENGCYVIYASRPLMPMRIIDRGRSAPPDGVILRGSSEVVQAACFSHVVPLKGLRRVFWARRREAASRIFRRAIERGELRVGTDPMFALELAIAPLYLRLLITDEPLRSDLPERIADAVLDGLGTPPKPMLRSR